MHYAKGEIRLSRKKALSMYLLGTLGQIMLVGICVYILQSADIETGYATVTGMLLIGVGGISSALWGIIVSTRYKGISVKSVVTDFFDVRVSYGHYILAILFLLLDFGYVCFGGSIQVNSWYVPVLLFLKAILFGGIEEIGWRYTFQPIVEEKIGYVPATLLTFVCWGVWHFLYFYVEGTISQVQTIPFLLGLLTNCFMLSALYKVSNSLWICVLTHALINTVSQIASGGSDYLVWIGRIAIVIGACMLSKKQEKV